MMRTFLVALVVSLLAAPSAAQDTIAMPGWMSGCWHWRDGERWGEECWTVPRAGQMLGSGRTGGEGAVASWEFMRIESGEEGLRFLASPGGQGWTAFAAAPDAEGVTFVNGQHDYPQRVRYWREGDRLMAEISLADGSRPHRWSFTRMGS